MSKIFFSVDPKLKYDLDQVQEYIDMFRNKYHKSYSSYSSTFDENNTVVDTNNNEEIKEPKEEIIKYKSQIELLEKEKVELEDKIKSLETQESENLDMYRILEDENNKLMLENSRLKSSLKDYEKDTFSEELFTYVILSKDPGILTRSEFDNEPFKAKIDYPNKSADFKFNSDTDQHSYFISNREILETFCEILNEVKHANFIEHVDWGKGEYIETNKTIFVKTKAKVNLVIK